MKKVLLAILSLCLIAASLFGLFTGVNGMKDVLNVKDYKTEDQESGLAAINDELLPGIQQLRDNYDTYMDGVAQFEDGKVQLANGEAQLAAGAQQLADGEAKLAAGKAELAANTDAYNKGKELQGTLNTVNGLIGQWKATKEAIVNSTSDLLHNNPLDPLDLGGNTYDAAIRSAEQTFLSTVRSVLSTDLITNTLGMAIDIPDDADNFPNWFQGFVADANAKLQMYEDGQRQVAAGEAQLAQGYADYAAGQQQLADGKQQLAEGEAQLAQFENGQVTLAVGLCRLLSQPAYVKNVGQVYPAAEVPNPIIDNIIAHIEESDQEAVRAAAYPGFWDTEDTTQWAFPVNEGEGDEVCPSVLSILRQDDRLGPNFNPVTDLFMQENGDIMVRNGYPVVNLDVAEAIANAGLDYINVYQGGAVMKEVIGKLITYALMLIGSVAGLLGGLFGLLALFGKCTGAAKVFGWISAISAIGGVIASFVTGGFKGYSFGVSDGSTNPWGHIIGEIPGKEQLKAVVILACVALLFAIVASMVRKAYKKAKKAVKAQAYNAAAPVQPVYAAPAQTVAQPVYAAPQAEVNAAVSAAQAAAAAAQKAAAEAQAAAAAGDVAAAQKAAAAAAAAAEAAQKAAE